MTLGLQRCKVLSDQDSFAERRAVQHTLNGHET